MRKLFVMLIIISICALMLSDLSLAATVQQQSYIKAFNTESADGFGFSLAISGNTLVVGSPHEDSGVTGIGGNQDDNSATNSGAVYIFVRNGEIWTQQAYIKASNTNSGDSFGWSVAIDGDTVVVGAPLEDSVATEIDGDEFDNTVTSAGAAYVFVRNGTVWSQQAYLKPSNTDIGDMFGESVGIYQDTVAVSAWGEDSNGAGEGNNSLSAAGAAYIFTRNGFSWTQEAYLKASNPGRDDNFGRGNAIAIHGDTIVVGAVGEDSNATGVDGSQSDNSASGSGAAYVFTRVNSVWSQRAYLKASNSEAFDQFGHSVAVNGASIAIGTYREDSNATGINGNQNDNSASEGGAVYIYRSNGSFWSQEAYIKASNTNSGDRFGWALDLADDKLLVGAYWEDSLASGINGDQGGGSSSTDAGAAYLFSRDSGAWSQQAYLKASNPDQADEFGISVAIYGNTIAVGARNEDSSSAFVDGDQVDNAAPNSGAVYVFDQSVNRRIILISE